MRVLITGAGGQLGRELLRALAGHELLPLDRAALDVTDAAAVEGAVASFRPDAVAHAAALTDTARCEREPELALAANARGAQHMAAACLRHAAAMIFVSTNEVFDGRKGQPYLENDKPNPINAYGRSKAEGERMVRQTLNEHCIVRTAWLYGAGGDNFVERVLRWAAQGSLTGVTDEIATPTWTRDLADAIATLIASRRFGTYHLTNAGEGSRYEWMQQILSLAGRGDVVLRPATTAEYRAALPEGAVAPGKPPYSVLANVEAARLGVELRDWREALRDYFAAR
jgi:dTDP-4-dehydrorhamnose reductase